MYNAEGEKVRHLFGTWHEAMFCGEEDGEATCVWQAGMSRVEPSGNGTTVSGRVYVCVGLSHQVMGQLCLCPITQWETG